MDSLLTFSMFYLSANLLKYRDLFRAVVFNIVAISMNFLPPASDSGETPFLSGRLTPNRSYKNIRHILVYFFI